MKTRTLDSSFLCLRGHPPAISLPPSRPTYEKHSYRSMFFKEAPGLHSRCPPPTAGSAVPLCAVLSGSGTVHLAPNKNGPNRLFESAYGALSPEQVEKPTILGQQLWSVPKAAFNYILFVGLFGLLKSHLASVWAFLILSGKGVGSLSRPSAQHLLSCFLAACMCCSQRPPRARSTGRNPALIGSRRA